MIINRLAEKQLSGKLQKGKVLILYGTRRTGKTFLLEQLNKTLAQKEKILYLNGESGSVHEQLSTNVPEKLRAYIGGASLLMIDEAQKIPAIGATLKLIADTNPGLKIVVSGSASFDLAQKVGEPLTGRHRTVNLYPISAGELILTKGAAYYHSVFEQHLIYGGYPELFSLPSLKQRQEYLDTLAGSYLFKDILELDTVRGAKKLKDLLILLAFQIGHEVSLSELGNNLDLHKNTVARYLDLLEKSFVIVNIRGFSRNLRKEVYKTSRYYFVDNGIRNSLINNFNPPRLRDDIGMLWENYIVMERLKKQKYSGIISNNYFWRTYDKKEVDWVEERNGKLSGYEMKWGAKQPKAPREWLETYKNATYKVISKENYLDFIV